MSLAVHSRLGPYEITAKLGAGGMGEVWRATDSQLGREVALKVLPAAVAADPERAARFEREARVLASLNHPNIAQIYGFETSGEVRALVMELVEGPTLAERLAAGSLPLDECLAVGLAIAEALEAAHEKGIVHRDLKPQNVKLAPDGRVKVLDFGLAKALADEPAATASLADSPTVTRATALGVILGTAAYMSPEQAKGKAVDRRADIWAFGVVLYECLTGKRLFEGETAPETLAWVLTREPDLAALPASTPSRLRDLLRRCLTKDPRHRLQAIGDARVALEEILGQEGEEAASAAAPRRAPGRGLLVAGLLAALAIGLAAGWLLRRPAPPPAPDARWALALPDGVTLAATDYPQIALSRDGRLQAAVVYDAEAVPRLVLRSEDQFAPRIVPDSERAGTPFFSPDGAWIAFFRDGGLYKVPVAGGPPVRLAASSEQPRGGAWSPDGHIYFTPDTGVGLSRVSENGGEPEPVTTLDEARAERTHRWPDVLPDGSAVVFTSDTVESTEFYDDARIEAVRPATGERKVLVEGSSLARAALAGHLVFARGGSLFAIGLDPRALEVRGTPVQVAQGVATDVGSGAVQVALAPSGAALWTPGGSTASFRQLWVDRAGNEASLPLPEEPYNELAMAPDGHRVALVGGQAGVADLWVGDLELGTMTRLTFGETVTSPVWTPDGTRIAYATRVQNADAWQIAWKPADGSREAEVLVEYRRSVRPSSFSPDGRSLIFDRLHADATGRDILQLSLDGERREVPLVEGPFMKGSGVVSPDGRWLAYMSTEGGRGGVYVRPFPAGEGRWQVSIPNGQEPRWRGDGRELYYRADGVLYAVAVDASRSFAAGRPQRLFDRVSTGVAAITYTPAPDGARFLTFRSAEGRGSLRTVYFDPGFGRRLAALARR